MQAWACTGSGKLGRSPGTPQDPEDSSLCKWPPLHRLQAWHCAGLQCIQPWKPVRCIACAPSKGCSSFIEQIFTAFQADKEAPGHAYRLKCLETSHVAGTDADLHSADYSRIPLRYAQYLCQWNAQAHMKRADSLVVIACICITSFGFAVQMYP